jgi:hypothetical protein
MRIKQIYSKNPLISFPLTYPELFDYIEGLQVRTTDEWERARSKPIICNIDPARVDKQLSGFEVERDAMEAQLERLWTTIKSREDALMFYDKWLTLLLTNHCIKACKVVQARNTLKHIHEPPPAVGDIWWSFEVATKVLKKVRVKRSGRLNLFFAFEDDSKQKEYKLIDSNAFVFAPTQERLALKCLARQNI